ncbi:hypothetical protein PINS_up009275 [Pythium insidiosum]|nr:hypothetical protein PINS_up009275 [Pythium insidiosum]
MDGTANDDSASEATAAPSNSKKRRLVNGKSVGDSLLARKDQEIRGHTAFLTFASKFFA